ncbi:ZIP family metal transporter, partial [Aeromonas enteropelogenes]
MDDMSALPASSWSQQLRAQMQSRPRTALGLFIALAAVLLLLLQSLVMLATEEISSGMRYGLIGGAAGFAATALGALPALFLRAVPQRVEDSMLGFAAGMMLAASAFSLLLPGLDAASDITGNGFAAAAVVVAGMTLGVLLMLGLDQFTPHEHDKTGPCGPGHEQCSRVWLFVFAIALHNLPEGMAIGVSFSQGDMSV